MISNMYKEGSNGGTCVHVENGWVRDPGGKINWYDILVTRLTATSKATIPAGKCTRHTHRVHDDVPLLVKDVIPRSRQIYGKRGLRLSVLVIIR